jgi:hypothetical protein
MPMNIEIATAAMIISVAEAFFASGGLNAGVPSEIASTPVIAVQPLAKAVSSANVVSVPALNAGSGSAGGGSAGMPCAARHNPLRISATMMPMKP